MKAIVAIGGGIIATKGTLAIDREIIRLSGKTNPRVLFIPTASSDCERYWKSVREYFGGYLHCKTDVLFLLGARPTQAGIREKLFAADIVYVGGGNTLKMIRVWKRLGVDKLLRQAYRKGKVLCGISAGSICWYESGHSDSMSFYRPKNWKYIKVGGLGFLKGIHCPHYNGTTLGVSRRKSFQDMIQQRGGFGIAIENNCAIEIIDGKSFKVITSKARAGAYRVYKKHGRVTSERIEQTEAPMPLAGLYKRG